MTASRKVFYWNRWGRAVARGKELCRRFTRKVMKVLEVLRTASPKGFSTKELAEATDDPYAGERIRRLYRSDPELWDTVFRTPEKPGGEFKMFPRDQPPNQNRGGGFGPLRR